MTLEHIDSYFQIWNSVAATDSEVSIGNDVICPSSARPSLSWSIRRWKCVADPQSVPLHVFSQLHGFFFWCYFGNRLTSRRTDFLQAFHELLIPAGLKWADARPETLSRGVSDKNAPIEEVPDESELTRRWQVEKNRRTDTYCPLKSTLILRIIDVFPSTQSNKCVAIFITQTYPSLQKVQTAFLQTQLLMYFTTWKMSGTWFQRNLFKADRPRLRM